LGEVVAVRSSSVVGPARRRIIVGLFATGVSFALLTGGVAVGATVTTNFDGFTPGTINGQGGWRSGPQVDEAVVSSGGTPTFGLQSLRMSNLVASSAFADQTYSTPVVPPAGENQPNTVYIAKFSFISPSAQEGLFMSVSPDSGDGSRMAWVGLADTEGGIKVTASDSPNEDGKFADYVLGQLSYGEPHTIEFRIKLNPGPDNDLVRILIDGQDFGQCFTTWENYYRVAPEQSGPPNLGEPPNLNSLQFRASVPSFHVPNAGFLFDNVTVTTGTGPSSPGCDVTIDKQADAPSVNAAGRAGYQITVRNRGHVSERNVRVCDRIPRRMTFMHADRKMSRVGRARCFTIARLAPGQRVSAHVVLAVDADAPQGSVTNIADITPGVDPPGSTTSRADVPGGALAASRVLRPVRRARAVVRVLARRARRPSFTG
jgi:uncharacterized repeat protein (TIGR01451 family)